MNPGKLLGVLLLVLGLAVLAYGGFSYTKTTHTADIGDLHLQVNEKERVNLPIWLGIGAVAGGLVLLVAGRKR